jgi:hypothetical protein
MSGAMPSLPNTPSWRGAELKQRDNFYLCPKLGSLNTVPDERFTVRRRPLYVVTCNLPPMGH